MLHVQMVKQLHHFTLDVTFHVNDEITCLFGPSGSGKTTILHCIAGLTSIDSGEIRLHDKMLTRGKKQLVPIEQRNIGYVFQDYALFPHKTVRENITYAMRDEQMTFALIETLGIDHIIDRYPHEISGGEKQRVALIRALATKPKLLLLDEPFTALDAKTKAASIAELKQVHEKWHIPILFVTHDQTEVERLAERTIFIKNGDVSHDYNV